MSSIKPEVYDVSEVRNDVGVGPSQGHRQYAPKFFKDRAARVVPEISSRTDRHRHTQTYSSQYFAIAPAGEVNYKRNIPE